MSDLIFYQVNTARLCACKSASPLLGEQSALHFAASSIAVQKHHQFTVTFLRALRTPATLQSHDSTATCGACENAPSLAEHSAYIVSTVYHNAQLHGNILESTHALMLAMVCQGLYYMYEDKCAVKWRTYAQQRLCVPCRRTLCGPLNHGHTFSPHSTHLSTSSRQPIPPPARRLPCVCSNQVPT